MKQKNYRWLVYTLIVLVLIGIVYVAFQNITPVSHHVETPVEIHLEK
jgi:hypothetical protein